MTLPGHSESPAPTYDNTTVTHTICPFSGSPFMCSCPDEARWDDENEMFIEPDCRGDKDPVTYVRLDALLKWLRRPGGNPGLHPFHTTADAIERKFGGEGA